MSERRPEVTQKLSEMVARMLNPHHDPRIYMAREVTYDYSSIKPIRVDFMRFEPVNNTVSGIEKGDFYCYEVKSSVADFHSKNGHNFIGDYGYYVMPRDVFEKVETEIGWYIGVYCPDGDRLVSVKKAHRMNRNRPVAEMLLMMFRSANRDALKGEKNMSQAAIAAGKALAAGIQAGLEGHK